MFATQEQNHSATDAWSLLIYADDFMKTARTTESQSTHNNLLAEPRTQPVHPLLVHDREAQLMEEDDDTLSIDSGSESLISTGTSSASSSRAIRHMRSEKFRRKMINGGFERLQKQLSSPMNTQKLTKAQIMDRVVLLIESLKKQNQSLEVENQMLKHEKQSLLMLTGKRHGDAYGNTSGENARLKPTM